MKKNIILLSAADTTEIYTPVLWASAKSYYEIKGSNPDRYNWVIPTGDYLIEIEEIQEWIRANPPDIFGISLYVWNFRKAMAVAKWVKETYPNCLVISGGQHQYFKHDTDWFKNNPWLDASLPGDEYGERTIADILDNLNDDNTVNWNKVNCMVYPSKTRDVIMKSMKAEKKRDFFWDYSPYDMQFESLDKWSTAYTEYAKIKNVTTMHQAVAKLETTRGCPYGCTYCDWGGGSSSKVISKSLEAMKKEVEAISRLKIWYCYICDANTGILGQRDIDVLDYFVESKLKTGWPKTIHVGGFAKTVKATETIRTILTRLAEHGMDQFKTYKIAIQTLDPVTQENIDRTDVPIEVYSDLAKYMKSKFGYQAHAEVILGLPGQTVDNFYYELQEFTKHDFAPQFYPWCVLPESPSYDPEYRKKYQVEVIYKSDVTSSPYYSKINEQLQDVREKQLGYTELLLVCSTYSYTRSQYAEMVIMSGLYACLFFSGILKTLLDRNLSTKEFFKNVWDLRNDKPDNAFAKKLVSIHGKILNWLDSPYGNTYYEDAINEDDSFQYSMENYWLQLFFFEPTDTQEYFEYVLEKIGLDHDLDYIFARMITKHNYQTATNRHWRWQNQSLIRSFGRMIRDLQVFNKPNDTFLIDNCR